MNIKKKILILSILTVSIFIIVFSLPLGIINNALIPNAYAIPEPSGMVVLLATGLYFWIKKP
jgi:hypothetical protein